MKNDPADDIEMVPDTEEGDALDQKEKIRKLKEKLERVEAEKKEYLDGWQRAKADLVNSRRDEESKLSRWRERVEGGIVQEFLSALDSFDLALTEENRKHLGTDAERAFTLIRSQFADVLRRLDVETIIAVGVQFNPSIHEAIEEVISDKPEGIVTDELQKGYTRRGVLLRPSRVKVSKTKEIY